MVKNRHDTQLATSAGIYLHVPFCIFKCPYCDYYSIENEVDDRSSRSKFVDSLLSEIKANSNTELDVGTIYIGGGTPSVLSGDQIQKILDTLREHFTILGDAEITLEANPDEIYKNKLIAYNEAGVNRLSIGAQSFQSEELKRLGRIHSPDDIGAAVEAARESGIDNINLDLIYGIPGQSADSARDNARKTIRLKPKHISVYSLTYEKDTPYYDMKESGEITPVDDNLEEELNVVIKDVLENADYKQYEISSYSLHGHESKHNSSYWNGAVYFGFGPSAHSFDGKDRWWNLRDVDTYMKKINNGESPIDEREELSREQLIFERIFLKLRTIEGLHLPSFEREFGIEFEKRYKTQLKKIDELNESGIEPMLLIEDDYLFLSEQGIKYTEEISALFAP